MAFERSNAQNLRAGASVFGAIALGACVLLLAQWWQARGMVEYTVTCTIEQGVYGLRAGSPVRVGGLVRGHVTAVRPVLKDTKLVGYGVDISLSRSVVLYRAARIHATTTGIAGDGAVDVVDTGRGRTTSSLRPSQANEAGVLQAGEEIASISPHQYQWLVGSDGAKTVGELAKSLPAAWASLRTMGESAQPKWEAARSELAQLSNAMRGDAATWRRQWEEASTHAQHAIESMGAGKDGAPDAFLPVMRSIKEDAADIDFHRIGIRTKFSRDALASAVSTLDALIAQTTAIKAALLDPDSSLGAARADFAIAGAELSATKREVMAQLWTLIGFPTPQQIREAQRIEEARVFAQAATEFERAVASLRDALIRDAELLKRTPGLAELLSTQLQQSSAQFESAVARYGEMLLHQPK